MALAVTLVVFLVPTTDDNVNTPPELDLNINIAGTGNTVVFQEGQGSINIAIAEFITLTDDNDVVKSIECNLSNPADGTDEFLSVTVTLPTGLKATYSTNSYTVVISGTAAISSYVLAISSIQYNSITTNPKNTTRQIDCHASDGVGDSNIATVEVTFRPNVEIQPSGQRPSLSLFSSGANVTTIAVVLNTAQEYIVSLITNNNTENLVTDDDGDVRYVVAKLNGGGDESESIIVDLTKVPLHSPVLIYIREGGEFEIRTIAHSSATHFSAILVGLSYTFMLTSNALSHSQRNVTITAYDEFGPGNTQTALIELYAPTQYAPMFTQNVYTISILENTTDGTEITMVLAIIPGGHNVTYFLNSTVFSINATTGSVYIIDSNALNYEDRTYFTQTISALNGDPLFPLTSEATLTIYLTNVNDNDPVFDQDSYEANVPENVESVLVVTLRASDEDGDSLQYFFADTQTENTFRININTGVISLQDQLDFEYINMYVFNVIVSDGERSDTATVTVSVTDVADGRPVVLPLQKDILLNLDDGNKIYFFMHCVYCIAIAFNIVF